MIKVLLFLLFVIFQGCGLPQSQLIDDPRESVSSSSLFSNYIQDFEDDYYTYTGNKIDISSIPIHFSEKIYDYKNKNGVPLGLCRTWNGGQLAEILVNEKSWKILNETARKILIYHELGHCALRRGHRSDKSSVGAPMSIMHPYLIGSYYFNRYEDEYFRELFLNEDW